MDFAKHAGVIAGARAGDNWRRLRLERWRGWHRQGLGHDNGCRQSRLNRYRLFQHGHDLDAFGSHAVGHNDGVGSQLFTHQAQSLAA